ncbi:MAG TPA: zinc-binding dehydrogenase [Anaeromyxobacteraceae bacterium]|nr:zinc-binding dehydrogenase [Anaeromyxobacteraceae bacterium]
MRAIAMRAHGGPEVLRAESLPDPAAGPGQVLVRVRSVALNHLDVWVRRGWEGLKLAWPHIPGSDVAGVVEEVGPGVTAVSRGDEVVLNPGLSCGRCRECLLGNDPGCRSYAILGEHVSGGYAELVAVPAVNVVPKPRNLSFDEAAAVPLVFLTAWHAIVVRANVRPGETVLVHAAGSGVGSAAVQIARLLGATVVATAGTDEKCRRALELGAQHAVNYEAVDFVQEVKKLTARRGVDVVFEHVGKKTWEKSLLALASGGRLVTVGATTGHDPPTDLRHVFYRRLSILGSTMGAKGELFDVLRFLSEGKLRPVVDRVLPLSEAAAAQELLSSRAQFGKIVLNP